MISGVRMVLLGRQGAGKGTQCVRLARHYVVPHISTGDMLRAAVKEGTEFGRRAGEVMDAGGLVSDEIMVGIVNDRLHQSDTTRRGYVLDGFPRTVPQAEVLDDMLREQADAKLDVVLELVVDDDEVIRRLSGRRTCRTCNHIWHVDFDPPKVEGVCDLDGGALYQRDDDKAETIANRLDVYAQSTAPLVSYYAGRGLLVGIDATGPVDDVTQRAIDALRPFSGAADPA